MNSSETKKDGSESLSSFEQKIAVLGDGVMKISEGLYTILDALHHTKDVAEPQYITGPRDPNKILNPQELVYLELCETYFNRQMLEHESLASRAKASGDKGTRKLLDKKQWPADTRENFKDTEEEILAAKEKIEAIRALGDEDWKMFVETLPHIVIQRYGYFHQEPLKGHQKTLEQQLREAEPNGKFEGITYLQLLQYPEVLKYLRHSMMAKKDDVMTMLEKSSFLLKHHVSYSPTQQA